MMRRLILFIAVAVLLARGQVLTLAAGIPDLVTQVSQGQYQSYHLTIESMGMPGTDYDGDGLVLGHRGRWTSGGSSSVAPTFSEGNQDAAAWITGVFSSLATPTNGLTVSSANTYKNIIATLPGTAPAAQRKTYIIGAHYDHLGGPSGTPTTDYPGGDDNASGVAAMLEAARVLTGYQFEHNLVFIAFNAEERGLWGSYNYVNQLTITQKASIGGMVSLDMVLRPGKNNDPSWVIDLDPCTKNDPMQIAWANIFRTAALDPSYATGLQVDTPFTPPSTNDWGRSDHQPFVEAGIPAFLAIENKITELGANPYYHTIQDASFRDANLVAPYYDYLFATQVTRATVAAFAQEAVLIPEPMSVCILALGACGWLVSRRRQAIG